MKDYVLIYNYKMNWNSKTSSDYAQKLFKRNNLVCKCKRRRCLYYAKESKPGQA